MNKKILASLFIVLLVWCWVPVAIAEKTNENWVVKLADGTRLTKNGFRLKILKHRLWLETRAADGERLNLEGAIIKDVDLKNVNLSKAKMNKTTFESVSLEGVLFSGSELGSAVFRNCTLIGARFLNASLPNVTIYNSQLNNTKFDYVVATKVFLPLCNFSNSRLYHTNLTGVNCENSNFKGAILDDCKLTAGYFKNINFSRAVFRDIDCMDANFINCDFFGTYIGMLPGKIPTIKMLATGKNIDSLSYSLTPLSLIELRDAAKRAGTRPQERKLTYAIRRNERIRSYGPLRNAISFVMFESPCGWGMNPYRPLLIMFISIPAFFFPYLLALLVSKKDGIWQTWPEDRARSDLGSNDPQRLKFTPRNWRAYLYALYFSVLSAFHIGWRDLNVGTWITRMQPRE
ncbi:MAG: pentapeptide repeat-containing protein [Desulfarculus sp.]|nr:pentapeptide repeat-containing protein [Pseudomonadota bacterium]MBU4599695.1 pentapeptide repeat-containing protein [Pseudomonadota bacterium]MBV1715032.1 pentapeptide repeat-containing protein [Desulfarculus sp.]MBV1739924.1 pentapeptide repeat-containing protein [Desulfarculus sp.]MBV1752237.1 pentapeptide repeat-containing protein [Desulfarculus sp.]